MVSEKERLRELRDKRSDLYLESLRLGNEVREMEAHIRGLKPQDRVEREVRENWNLTLGILKKVGIISTTEWAKIPRDAMPLIYALHHVRRDARQAIAKSLGIKLKKVE